MMLSGRVAAPRPDLFTLFINRVQCPEMLASSQCKCPKRVTTINAEVCHVDHGRFDAYAETASDV